MSLDFENTDIYNLSSSSNPGHLAINHFVTCLRNRGEASNDEMSSLFY